LNGFYGVNIYRIIAKIKLALFVWFCLLSAFGFAVLIEIPPLEEPGSSVGNVAPMQSGRSASTPGRMEPSEAGNRTRDESSTKFFFQICRFRHSLGRDGAGNGAGDEKAPPHETRDEPRKQIQII